MVDPGTVGILYEGSTAQLVFQTVKLRDIVRSADDGLSWRSLPETAPAEAGYAAGVSAMYAGAAGDALIAAGGANFPDVPPPKAVKKPSTTVSSCCAAGFGTGPGGCPLRRLTA